MFSPHLDSLIARGRQLLDALASDARGESALAAARGWQQECAAAVNQLAGGSKAHWLARAYSEAFLVRPAPDRFVEEASLTDIIGRILQVLERAATSLAQPGDRVMPQSPDAAAGAPRFDFVHNRELRPVLEQAYTDSRQALELGRFGRALVLSCSVLEAIITDALAYGRPEQAETLSAWSFDTRLSVAEQAGLIRGCARLPPLARQYRDLTDAEGDLSPAVTVSERDARVTGQVLHVVMRDLNPSR